MDKPTKFSNSILELSQVALDEDSLDWSLIEKSSIKPSAHLIEMTQHNLNYPKGFWERVLEVLENLRNSCFGLTYDMLSKKMLPRNKDNKTLIEALCYIDKYRKENKNLLPAEILDIYEFLKLVLEDDAPLFGYEEYIFSPLGIQRDLSGISKTRKRTIAVQAVAQILWHIEKNNIPTIAAMRRKLLDKENPLYTLLKLNQLHVNDDSESRSIENWVREVFPPPKDKRTEKRTRPSLKAGRPDDSFNTLISIPEIFWNDGNVINFPKLRFAIIALTMVLRTMGWSFDQIRDSNFIHLYQRQVPFQLELCMRMWIIEAFNEPGNILDL